MTPPQNATEQTSARASLHRRLLGEAFETLPPVLRRFHGAEQGGTARGILCVTRGGWLASRLAAILRLPEAGGAVPLRLRVTVEGERERWRRWFGDRCLESVQWEQDGLLVEAAGLLRLGYRVTAEPGGMRFECRRLWLGALPLPARMAGRTRAVLTAGEQSWHVRVEVTAPLVGRLLTYEGEIISE
jgi:hypothetical protein